MKSLFRRLALPVMAFIISFQAESQTLPDKEVAIDFLYSTMSLPDSSGYSRDFFKQNVDATFRALDEMPWGKTLPRREFLHFVLPVRINNENLDLSRPVFYEELKNRVKDLSMKEAIMEVNHWCHEKVAYQASDSRTSSPLSALSQAIGRCGEESTFTVAALRAVGIPARQIYTPRWAHTDDNHAWVEAWADGQWYFLGACEPEPVLNLAWFNEPASRGLLMSTNVVGDQYDGPEEVLLRQPLTTRINVTENYAPVTDLNVQVVDKNGKPVDGASVNFCIYNYAEYFPAVTKTADSMGRASLTAGMGDMVVWATDGRNFGLAKGRPGQEGECVVTLDKDGSTIGTIQFDLTPPPSKTKTPVVTSAQREANNIRGLYEDSIRHAYIATFCSPEEAAAIAERLGLDKETMVKVLTESRGNHQKIKYLLEDLDVAQRNRALALLANVTEKDRRDIPMEVVFDAVENTVPYELWSGRNTFSKDIYDRYVLSPRIENEGLVPWRKIIGASEIMDEVKGDPQKLIEWIDTNIKVVDGRNPQGLRMYPQAVLATRQADALARGLFFVACARSMGIPARIDPVTGSIQYMLTDGQWQTVSFSTDAVEKSVAPTGFLHLSYKPVGHMTDPKYYFQFSLSKIENGKARLLEFDEGAPLSTLFASPVELEAGQYILTSGQRLANGGVLANSEIISINPGETTECELIIRQDEKELTVLGGLNAENIYHDVATDTDKSLLSTTGRGYYILGLIAPGHEPSSHALNDMAAVADELDKYGRKIMLLFADKESYGKFNPASFGKLPENVVFGIDVDGASRKELVESLHLDENASPIIVVADTFNRVVWVTTGYTIGTGDRLLEVLSRLQ